MRSGECREGEPGISCMGTTFGSLLLREEDSAVIEHAVPGGSEPALCAIFERTSMSDGDRGTHHTLMRFRGDGFSTSRSSGLPWHVTNVKKESGHRWGSLFVVALCGDARTAVRKLFVDTETGLPQ